MVDKGSIVDKRRYLQASITGALLSPILITAVGSWADGVRWDHPMGFFFYAFFFVAPFTLLGSFLVLWPLHRLFSPQTSGVIQVSLVLVIASVVGAALLGMLSFNKEVLLVGAFSGLCVAAVWLVTYHLSGRWYREV